MKLALVDNNSENLTHAKASIHDADNIETETYPLDVGKIEEWKDLRGEVEKKFGRVDLLMLNAGIGLKSSWEDTDYFHKVSLSFMPLRLKWSVCRSNSCLL